MSQTKAQLLDGKSATIQFTGGSASAPSVSFTGDTNTGIYSPGADQVAISTGGSGRLFVDASGNVEVVSNSNFIRTPFAVTNSGTSGVTLGVAQSFKAFTGSVVDSVGGILGTGSTWAYGTYLANSINLSGGKSGGVGIRSGNSPIVFFTGNSDVDSSTERLRITSAGLVGVGTSSPSERLHVNGGNLLIQDFTPEILLRSPDGTSNRYFISANISDTGDGGIVIGEGANLDTGIQRLVINGSGNVGVGTTSPSSAFHLSNASTPTFLITDTRTPVTAQYQVGSSLAFVGTTTNHDLGFTTNNTERLRIDNSGRVGIGTSTTTLGGNPFRLVVVGTKTYSELIPRDGLAIADNTATAQGVGGSITLHGIYDGSGNYTAFGGIEGQKENGTSGNYAGALVLKSRTFLGNLNEAIRIDSAQRVGIGTTSPTQLLDVSGNSNGSLGQRIVNNSQGGSSQAILNFSAGGRDVNYAVNYTGQFYQESGSLILTKFCDFNTHIFRNTGATGEYARIDSSGRLLVGTSTSRGNNFNLTGQNMRLQVEGTDYLQSGASFTSNSNTAGEGPHIAINRSRGTTVGSNTVVQDGDRLGLIAFQGNDGADFVIGAAIDCLVDGTPGANDMPGRLVFSTTADGASSPTERMRIASNGTVFITQSNTGTYGEYIDFSSGGYGLGIRNSSGGSAELVYFFSPNYVGGITTSGSTTSYLSASDYRLKENIALVTDGITRLQQLKPIRFNFIADPSKTVDGFIAHEVQAVVPEAITGEKDAVDADGKPIYQGIDQSKLVPLLTAALQEAVAKIESLEARLTAAGI